MFKTVAMYVAYKPSELIVFRGCGYHKLNIGLMEIKIHFN